MTLSTKPLDRFYPLYGEIDETAVVEPSAEEAEALPLTLDNLSGATTFVYNVSTEDNGTVGILDDEAGITYSGPSGQIVRVKTAGFVGTDGAGLEATDAVQIVVYKNSTKVIDSDEGSSEIAETTVTFNIDGLVQLDEGDVIRFGTESVGEEVDGDIDVAPADFSIT